MADRELKRAGKRIFLQVFLERGTGSSCVMKFLIWCVLLVVCWPLALVALVVYPIVWLLLLPFRVVGIAVDGALSLVSAVILLPARLLRAA